MNIFDKKGGNLLSENEENTPYSDGTAGSGTKTGTPGYPEHYYEIRIKGQLSDIWVDWFEGFAIQNLDNGETLLSGCIVDQSALMGILNKLTRLNLAVISLNEVKT